MADVRKGFGFDNPEYSLYDGWGAFLTADELRYIIAFGSPLVAPDGQTITDDTLNWYIRNAIGWIEKDLNLSLLRKQYYHRPVKHTVPRTDIANLGAFSFKYESGGGSGTAATVTITSTGLTTAVTGEAGDNLSLSFSDYHISKELVAAINAASVTGTYTATLIGREKVPTENLVAVAGTDIFSPAEPTFDATQEPWVDFFWDEAYDYERNAYRHFAYVRLNHGPIIEVTKAELRDPTGGLIINMLDDLKVNHETGSVEFFPSIGLVSVYPTLFTPFGHWTLNAVYGERYPDAFWFDYVAGAKNATVAREKFPELVQVTAKLAGINLLADYGDGRSAGLASSSVGLSGLSESLSTTMSATSAFYGARIKQWYEDLKFFYARNRNKYRGLLMTSL